MAYDVCQVIIHEIVYKQLSSNVANKDSPVLNEIQVKILKCCHWLIIQMSKREFKLWGEQNEKAIKDIIYENFYLASCLLYIPKIRYFSDLNKQNPRSNGLPVCVAIQEYLLSIQKDFEKFAS